MQAHLLYNKWFGKAIGTVAACIFGPDDPAGFSVAIIVGIAAGHAYDWWAYRQFMVGSAGFAKIPKGIQGRDALATPHLRFLFAAMGALARVSGVVRKAHIDAAERLILRFNFTTAGRKMAIDWFNEGKSRKTPFTQLARDCLGADERSTQLRLLALESMCEVAAVTPTPSVIAELKQLGKALGFSNGRIAEVFGEAHVQIPRADARTSNPPPVQIPEDVARAADVLDVPADLPPEGIKRAYRRLVSRYHPDKLPNNATRKEIEYAQARMVEFREALEVLEAFHRS